MPPVTKQNVIFATAILALYAVFFLACGMSWIASMRDGPSEWRPWVIWLLGIFALILGQTSARKLHRQ